MSFKIYLKNACGLDVHKTWIYACIGIADANNIVHYHEKRFSSFTKGLNELAEWLAFYGCKDVCMESTGKYWIPVFNILEKTATLYLPTPSTQSLKKETRLTVKTPGSSAIFLCAV